MASEPNLFPFTLFHGTYYEFDYFRPLTHFGLEVNARANLNEGKWKRNPDIDITKPKIIPVKLVRGNYPEIPDLNDHSVDNWMGILFQYMCKEYIADYINALNQTDKQKFVSECKRVHADIMTRDIPVPWQFDWICEPINHTISEQDIQTELSTETLFDIHNAENLFFQRMIKYFESIGINGFSYANYTEGPGNHSYIIFRQNAVKRQDRVLPQYPEPDAQKQTLMRQKMDRFAKQHKYRMFTKAKKNKMLTELYNFYLFRFDEIANMQQKSWYATQTIQRQ